MPFLQRLIGIFHTDGSCMKRLASKDQLDALLDMTQVSAGFSAGISEDLTAARASSVIFQNKKARKAEQVVAPGREAVASFTGYSRAYFYFP